MTTTISTLSCPPRFGTQRNPDRATLGPAVAEVARRLNKPLMPWQQHVVDVALEVDGSGRLVYDEFGLTVPRQSGKSTLILAKAVHRAWATGFFGPRQRIVYTAQTRNKAREKWEEDYAADLKASASFGGLIKPHFGNGNEHIRFPNGSRFGIEANTEKAGHGGTLDEAYIDEAFAQVDNRLEQAFRPAMITRPNTQLGWVSTAGWSDGSPFLVAKVQRGREQVEAGVQTGLAYFEWSADPDADPEDPDVWRGCMPALGHTISEDAIVAELRAMADNMSDFRRAYLNQWVPRGAGEPSVIDPEAWVVLEDRGDTRPSPVAFSVEVSDDRKWAQIGLAGRRPDGRVHVQIVQAGRGTRWVPDRLVELRDKWKPVAVAVNPSGPAGSLLGALAQRGVDVVKVGGQELGQACGLFVDAVGEGSLAHSGQPQLAASVAAAGRRRTAQAWTWKANDGADISPLWSVTLALHALERRKQDERSGVVRGIR
jgi:hypothetical protein